MKKMIICFLFLIIGLRLIANPIPTPMVEISEIYFDPVNGWQIELEYLYSSQQAMPIDSIWICSSSGKSKLKDFQIIDPQGYIVVSNDSLISSIEIDMAGDSITVISFVRFGEDYTEPFQDILVFGNYPNSVISKLKYGHSIARIEYGVYSKDKSPSIGLYNDTTGMCGTLKGNIYDKDNQLISERTFRLSYEFETTNNGYYTTRLLSKNFQSNVITYKVGESYKSLEITPININMDPDSVIELNIYLLDSLLAGFQELKLYEDFPIKLYPNPVKSNQNINYIIDLPVKSISTDIELISTDGRILVRNKILDNLGSIDLPNQLTEGLLIFNIRINNEVQYSTLIIVCR